MFPVLYHAHHSLHPEDLPFWEFLARRQNGSILELGCGTGRVLMHLAEAGYTVLGLDNDPQMLEFLRSRLPAGLEGHVRLALADMTAFELPERYSLIITPCNTFSTLPASQRRNVLSLARAHLQPGGLFCASLPNPDELMSLPQESEAEVEEVFEHPLSSDPVQVSSSWQRAEGQFTLRWHYDTLSGDGQVARITAEARHWLAPAAEHIQAVQQAGLSLEGLYGDYDRSPYTTASPYLILLAART